MKTFHLLVLNMSLYFPFSILSSQTIRIPHVSECFFPRNCIETVWNEVESELQHINNLLQQPERNVEAIVMFILMYLANNANALKRITVTMVTHSIEFAWEI